MDPTMEHEEAAPPEAPKASLWEDLVDVFISPAELYRRRANDGWVKPWIVLSIIVLVLYLVFLGPNHELAVASTREMMARAGKEMPPGAEGGKAGQIVSGIFQPVGLLIGILLGAVLLWIASAVAEHGPRFKQAMMIMAWASFPMILQKVLSGVLVILKTNSGEPLRPMSDASTGVLRFLDTASLPLPLMSALAAVDLFIFWEVVLWAIALKAICGFSSSKAGVTAFATWLLMLLPLMGMGYLGQLAMGS